MRYIFHVPLFYNVPLYFVLLGTSSIFTKTPIFSKHIGGYDCYFQTENQTTKYSPGLKELLFSNKIYQYKEIASLLTPFTEHRLESDNSNFVFNRIFKILISLEAGHITHYDNLFCELFLHRYLTQVNKNVMFLTNITKVRHFKRKINLSESINFFLDQGKSNSDKHLMELEMVEENDKKVPPPS